jgi:hypothetical protein
MSPTRWIIVFGVLIAFAIYWVWESKRENLAKHESRSEESEESALPQVDAEVRKEDYVGRTLVEQKKTGNEAALRTERYSTLFDNIGNVMQIVNTVAACILIVPGFFIPGSGWIKAAYWLAIGILWAIAYVQTALIRGLSSYFQMKASDYIIRNWQN